MVNWVHSDPVPAVVGMAAIGGIGTSMTLPIKSEILPSYRARTPMAFMESKALPPPRPTRKSQRFSRYAPTPASIILSVGSPVTPEKTA